MSRPPFPPFTEETARQKVRMAEDAWNSRDPVKVSLAYTPDSSVAQPLGIFRRAAMRSWISSPANGRRKTTIV